ncbi:MAG: hypothetical protein U5K69_19295 [Balneolaceae bacterium]|nr:hypothetical protein [Balneolaceae bacterium]
MRSLWSAENIQGNGTRLEFEPYLQTADLTSSITDSLKSELTQDSFVEGFLINDQATATSFYLEINEDKNSFEVRQQIIEELTDVLDQYSGSYDFKLSGIPYYRNQYVNYLNREITFYITLSSVLIILLLWILFTEVLLASSSRMMIV